ncbi:MAG: helix-hairpin-helix domain-containing protein [Anaerolineae bacterium]|nr:helix-hairpin-helix domain-containing protein [Anaerolineae bacterium]MCI0607947.1 helix-hairpin-helix domain-containing protein [Anaerolineae bacterium]
MGVIASIVLGLLIGWLIEWVIDWFYWRGRIRPVVEENARLARDNEDLKERLAAIQTKVSRKSQLAKTRPTGDRAGKDNLQAIKGVGPVISKRLNEAGIYTFEELSQLTPDELQEIMGSLAKRFFPKQESILTQAKEFAEQKAQKS